MTEDNWQNAVNWKWDIHTFPTSESDKWRRHHFWHVPTPPNDSPGDGWCRLKSSVPITSVPPCQFEPVPEHEDDGLVTYQIQLQTSITINWFEVWIGHDTVSQHVPQDEARMELGLIFLHIQDIFKHIKFLMCILKWSMMLTYSWRS